MYDKKQEAQFRKACANWLTRIAKVSGEGVSYGGGGGMWSEELRNKMKDVEFLVIFHRKNLIPSCQDILHHCSCLLEVGPAVTEFHTDFLLGED